MGSKWLLASDKIPVPVPPPMSEQFPDQPIEDTNSPTPTICGVSRRAFWFLFTICVLFMIVIGLAAGLGATLGKRNHSSSPAQTTASITSSNTTQTTQTTTAITSLPAAGQWKLQNGGITVNYTQVSASGPACAPTGLTKGDAERGDTLNIVTKGTGNYLEASFGTQLGVLSSELIYIPETNTTAESYVSVFTFPQGTIALGCNSSSSYLYEFVRNGSANFLYTTSLINNCIGQDGTTILARAFCKIYYQGDLPANLDA